jgi:PilZ domain
MLEDGVLERGTEQSAHKISAPSERRAWVRHPCDLESACQPLAGGRGAQWPARIRNLSAGGIGINVARRFEPGTVLAIDVQIREQRVHTLMARVVHATLQENGSWILGCALTSPLTEDELKALL